MTHPYRAGPPQPTLPRQAPRASWWRLLCAWRRGTLRRIAERRERIALGTILFGPGWRAERVHIAWPTLTAIKLPALPAFQIKLPRIGEQEDEA